MIAGILSKVVAKAGVLAERVFAAAPDVVFTCVTEPTKEFLDQSARLVLSLRWFGGRVADARFVLGCTGPLPASVAAFFRQHRVEIIHVERHDASHGPSNKISLLAAKELAGHDTIALLDCDTVIVRDPSEWLTPRGLAAKPADMATVTHEQLDVICRDLGVAVPEPVYRHDVTGKACGPYCNSGVVIVRDRYRAYFAATWEQFNRRILARLDEGSPRSYFFDQVSLAPDQVSLALAIVASRIPFEPLPSEMNLAVHLELSQYPEAFAAIDPAIIHYHGLAYPDGYLKPVPLAKARQRVESFNARLRAEHPGGRRVSPTARRASESPKVMVGSGWWCDKQPHAWALGTPRNRTIDFFDLWRHQVVRCLQPARIIVTDSAAPEKPDYRTYGDVEWVELDRNYGHPNDLRVGKIKTKYSGNTRPVINGAMYALCCDADWYAYVEQGCLLYGDHILTEAVGDSNAEIFLGMPTEGGKGIGGQVAAPMLQMSFILVRRSGLERFIAELLRTPWSDGEKSPEEIMRLRLEPFDLLKIPFGRSRPIDFTRSHFYVKHCDDAELDRFIELIGAKLPQDTFWFTETM
jgi:hypothetical protein